MIAVEGRPRQRHLVVTGPFLVHLRDALRQTGHGLGDQEQIVGRKRQHVGDVVQRHLRGLEHRADEAHIGDAFFDRLKLAADLGDRAAIRLGPGDTIGVTALLQAPVDPGNEALAQRLHPQERRRMAGNDRQGNGLGRMRRRRQNLTGAECQCCRAQHGPDPLPQRPAPPQRRVMTRPRAAVDTGIHHLDLPSQGARLFCPRPRGPGARASGAWSCRGGNPPVRRSAALDPGQLRIQQIGGDGDMFFQNSDRTVGVAGQHGIAQQVVLSQYLVGPERPASAGDNVRPCRKAAPGNL